MENIIMNNRQETLNKEQAMSRQKKVYVMRTICVALLILLSITICAMVNLYMEAGDIIPDFVFTLYIGWAISIFAAIVILDMVANHIDSKNGGYYCKKCGQVHYPTEVELAQSFAIFQHKFQQCPNCKKYSWNVKSFYVE